MKASLLKKTLFACATVMAATAAHAQVTKWDLPSGYALGSFQTENLQTFIKDVETATHGRLLITLHANGALYKANEIKRAVQTHQVQAGEFILSGSANENPLFGVDSIPFLADSYASARKLADASLPHIETLLSRQGMKLLYTVPWPGQSLYTTKPVNTMSDLKGTKMRAYNPATSRIAELVGAQPATIQLSELGQALATGIVDNFLTSSASGVEYKLYESVKYFYPVSAWLPKNAVVVSTQAFDALDKPTQDAVLKAAAEADRRGWRMSREKDDEYIKELSAKGMKVVQPSDALRGELHAIGERMTTEWLHSAGPEGKAIVDAYRAQ